MFLGLDLSLTSSGFCLLTGTNHYLTATAGSKVVFGVERLKLITDALEEFMGGRDNCITLAAIEGYAYSGNGHAMDIGELGGVVRLKLREWGVPFVVVGVSQLKKFATGNGSADKVQMGETARDNFDQDFLKAAPKTLPKVKGKTVAWGSQDSHWRNDEVDAYFLANFAALYAGQWDIEPTVFQREVIDVVKYDPHMILSKASKERKAAKNG